MEGAVKRVRPKIMTLSVTLARLVPIMLPSGTGADVMKQMAAVMAGVITSTIPELHIYPAIYLIWREPELKSTGHQKTAGSSWGRGLEMHIHDSAVDI